MFNLDLKSLKMFKLFIFFVILFYGLVANSEICEDTELYAKLFDDMADNPSLENAVRQNIDLADAWKLFSFHSVRNNPDFLEKASTATENQRVLLADLYEKISAPSGRNRDIDYFETRTIGNETVTVHYDAFGFPDFTPFSYGPDFVFDQFAEEGYHLVGGNSDLAAAARYLVGKFPDRVRYPESTGSPYRVEILTDGEWVIQTFHHHQDGRSLIPVPSSVHNVAEGGFRHSGGEAVIDRDLVGFFDPINFE